ncbi:MAG: hemolysin family protein, partial [Candidatus Zixiibacteriota bacterium]
PAILIVVYFTAYLASLYSIAVYIDPEELESLSARLSRSRQRLVSKLARDPRAFVQIAVIYKSIALIVSTVVIVLAAQRLAPAGGGDGAVSIVIALVVHWVLYLFAIEYLPRRHSRKAVNKRLVRRLWFIAVLWYLIFPFVRLYRRALEIRVEAIQVTEEEKDEIVERAIETLAEQAGISETIVEEDEKEMIGQIFRLDQTIVREIMVPRIDIVAINKSMSFTAIRKLVLEDGHSRYPVFNGSIDKILGIMYVKDLFGRMPEPGEKFVISKYLRKPYFVPETKVISELLREFKAKRLHIALAVDEYGGIAGLVTLEDIIEEIFGEIQDEHDWEEAPFLTLADGRVRVDAALLVEDLQKYLDTDYKQGDYDTVGGLIYDLVGSVPNEGQVIRWHDVEFEIERVEGQRIRYVNVRH